MNDAAVRFALVGCGRIAKNHVAPLTELDRARLVAVCDLLPERARPYAEKSGAKLYTNYHHMLRSEDIDVVGILTPSGMHSHHAMDIMTRYRKHVAIEKPMALALADLDKMKNVARQQGVKIFPIYQNRYNKAVRKIRSDVVSGALGKLIIGTVRLRWCRPQRYYDRDPWRGTWAMDGGALTNQGIHYIDLLQYLMGDVRSVYARTATHLVNVEVEDTAVAVLAFENGASGVIEVTTAARPADFEASISILGENGTAILTGIASNKLSTYSLNPAEADDHSEDFPDAYGFGHWPFYREIVQEMLNNSPHSISFEEGGRPIRLLNALYRSAEDHREVFLHGEPTSRRLGRPDKRLFSLYDTGPDDDRARTA